MLNKLGLDRPELRAWALYDWANSAFFTTVVTAVFPDFYSSVAAEGVSRATATARFAAATTIAVIIVAVMGPPLGAYADRARAKKLLLGLFAAAGIGATAMMPFIQAGDWPLASRLFIISNVGVAGSMVFYDSLLPHIAGPHEIDRVSTAGYALGYLGGGLLLLLNLAWILWPASFGLSGSEAGVRLSFLSVAIWWAVFTLPLLWVVPEPRQNHDDRGQSKLTALSGSFGHLLKSARELFGFRQAFLMLAAFLLYNDGIQTIIRMASIYGAEIGIDRNARIAAFVLVQFVGIPFAFAFGWLADRIGAKRSILFALAVYAGASVFAYFMTTAPEFFVLAFLIAMVQGGTQALSRSLFASMIPRLRSSEFFGIFSVFEKIAGMLGPAMFAAVTIATGSSRGAVLAIIVFFIAGAAVLSLVDVENGRASAQVPQSTPV